MALDWIVQRSTTGHDLDWHPVAVVVGLLSTETGVRFAVLMGDSLGILVPDADRDFAAHVVELVDAREGTAR